MVGLELVKDTVEHGLRHDEIAAGDGLLRAAGSHALRELFVEALFLAGQGLDAALRKRLLVHFALELLELLLVLLAHVIGDALLHFLSRRGVGLRVVGLEGVGHGLPDFLAASELVLDIVGKHIGIHILTSS